MVAPHRKRLATPASEVSHGWWHDDGVMTWGSDIDVRLCVIGSITTFIHPRSSYVDSSARSPVGRQVLGRRSFERLHPGPMKSFALLGLIVATPALAHPLQTWQGLSAEANAGARASLTPNGPWLPAT